MTLRFLLVCEGSSDSALIGHISRLLIQNGQLDPQGVARTGSKPLPDKIREGLRYSGACDFLLIHRDADADSETQSAGPKRRAKEIADAVRDSGYSGIWVGIVPVRMTEAWLLLDESAIRTVAGRPRSNVPLDLPSPNQVESEADPKAILEQILITASETSGRKRNIFRRDISSLKHRLLVDLPVGGPLEQVPSWVRFRDDLLAALASMDSSNI